MSFAISNDTGKVISVLEAKRGNDCNCRCISCNTPVTARKGGVNQIHFAHRIDGSSTSNRCSFSPITAIALILRQQLPKLKSFNLDGWDFTGVCWKVDTTQFGMHLDAFAQDYNSKRTIVLQIPFANGGCTELAQLPEHIDFVLKVDTQAIAQFLTCRGLNSQLKSAEAVYSLLLGNWGHFVEHLRCPIGRMDGDTYPSRTENIDIANESKSPLCVCCGEGIAVYGQGELCKICVEKYVGPQFININEMRLYYRNRLGG